MTLTARHEHFVGRAEGDGDPSHRHRLVGEATLKALQSLAPTLELDLSAVGTSDLGNLKVALFRSGKTARSWSAVPWSSAAIR